MSTGRRGVEYFIGLASPADNGALQLIRRQEAKSGSTAGITHVIEEPLPLRGWGSWLGKLQTVLRGLRAILSKWLLLTRLETRTKESTQYASVRVEKPERIRKLSIRCQAEKPQHRPTLTLRGWARARAYLVGPERW